MSAIYDDPIRSKVLITANVLAALLASGEDVVVLDVRPRSDGNERASSYHSGHIPGAVYVNFPAEVSGPGGGVRGRYPLPSIENLQRDARVWGLNQNSIVVTYGDRGPAARVWWVLRWAGVRNVRLLDGGIAAWVKEHHEVSSAVPKTEPGNVVLTAGHLPVVTADQAAEIARTGILLDARTQEAYVGGPARAGEPPSGHIPGAISAPTEDNLDADGHFSEPEALRKRFTAFGIGSKPLAVYCGGGVGATHEIAALASIGIKAALFPGSWSAWSADPNRPIATGLQPG